MKLSHILITITVLAAVGYITFQEIRFNRLQKKVNETARVVNQAKLDTNAESTRATLDSLLKAAQNAPKRAANINKTRNEKVPVIRDTTIAAKISYITK